MLLLVNGRHYVIMFIGWEGVGLCSYLLIGYCSRTIDYTKAAKKAFVMNRIGDLGFLLLFSGSSRKQAVLTDFIKIGSALNHTDIVGSRCVVL
jgi:NADH-quinone oxidoreductase subunit L